MTEERRVWKKPKDYEDEGSIWSLFSCGIKSWRNHKKLRVYVCTCAHVRLPSWPFSVVTMEYVCLSSFSMVTCPEKSPTKACCVSWSYLSTESGLQQSFPVPVSSQRIIVPEGYCRQEAQVEKQCLPSMLPLCVHIQLRLLSWPVLTSHSLSREKTKADTRFWWAATTKPSYRTAVKLERLEWLLQGAEPLFGQEPIFSQQSTPV